MSTWMRQTPSTTWRACLGQSWGHQHSISGQQPRRTINLSGRYVTPSEPLIGTLRLELQRDDTVKEHVLISCANGYRIQTSCTGKLQVIPIGISRTAVPWDGWREPSSVCAGSGLVTWQEGPHLLRGARAGLGSPYRCRMLLRTWERLMLSSVLTREADHSPSPGLGLTGSGTQRICTECQGHAYSDELGA